jgi:hypothetical protein
MWMAACFARVALFGDRCIHFKRRGKLLTLLPGNNPFVSNLAPKNCRKLSENLLPGFTAESQPNLGLNEPWDDPSAKSRFIPRLGKLLQEANLRVDRMRFIEMHVFVASQDPSP